MKEGLSHSNIMCMVRLVLYIEQIWAKYCIGDANMGNITDYIDRLNRNLNRVENINLKRKIGVQCLESGDQEYHSNALLPPHLSTLPMHSLYNIVIYIIISKYSKIYKSSRETANQTHIQPSAK